MLIGFADNEDAHQKHHDEEDPHEESVHDLGHLLPLGAFDTVGPLLSKAVGDVLDVPHDLVVVGTGTGVGDGLLWVV